ncbi:MAG: serine hydrolase [Ignavibacteria bacterium]|nr:serine hydrolase [Ignavibacteria bacterium]MBT8392774.1 serine hydrolase [Ignavibacteria bacterium]NNL22031.1 serine hydrolase [Ignavibacteriaceae bacterium]
MKIKNLIWQIFILPFAIGVVGLTPTQIDSIENIYSLQLKYPSVFPLTENDKTWIENKINELSIREKCAQLIMPAVYRDDLNPYSNGFDDIISLVRDEKIGGLILFQGGMEEQINFTAQMQQFSDIPLLISSDFERGLGTRIDEALEFPHAMALGSTHNPNFAYEVGRITAFESRQIGVHQIFAPVADINYNPMNPIINLRSFSEDKIEVTNFVKAFIKGAQETRSITTVKHFPGHGNTTIDSHYDLPRIEGSKDYLLNNELYPFIESIKHGIQSIMTGHLEVPSLEPVKGIPSSLSKSIITHLLKNELKFDGLIITDALIMDAITKFYSTGDAVVAAIEAGNDIILMPKDALEAIDALKKAVNSGRITLERLDESVRKILAAKRWLKIENENIVDPQSTKYLTSDNPNVTIAKKIAEESITLLKNDDGLIPVKPNEYKNIFCITITDKNGGYRTEYFNSKLEKRIGRMSSFLFTGKTKRTEYTKVLAEVDSADLIIIPSFIDVKTYKGPVNLSAEQIDFIAGVLKKETPTVLISLRNPYLIYLFPEAKTYLNSFSSSYFSQDEMIRALLGEIDIKGKMPITIPESELVYGSGIELLKVNTTKISYSLNDNFRSEKIYEQVENAINERLFPGAVVLAMKDGKIFYHEVFGKNGFGKNNNSIQKDDVFSIGKLTSLYTTVCALKLMDGRKFSADDKLSYYFDSITDSKKKNILIKNLVLHNSGFSPKLSHFKPYWKKDNLIFNILQEDLEYKTGYQNIYSSLNLVLLQEIIEKVSNEKLGRYFEINFRKPLSIFKSGYSYVRQDSAEIYYNPSPHVLISAKPQDDIIKNILNSDIEGTSGFDGFYTNAFELAVFVQMLLQRGYYDENQILNASTIENWIEDFHKTEILNSTKRKFELIDLGGCFLNINFDKNYSIIVLTNAEIKNPSNKSFVDFSKKLLQVFNEELSQEIL